jgi:tRNA(fMet)-specific endonuclease VapC
MSDRTRRQFIGSTAPAAALTVSAPQVFAAAGSTSAGVAIAAVTAAELMVGVELADRRRSPRRRAFVTALLESLPVEPYDLEVARAHAVLLGHTRRSGRARGAHDRIIAATGVARGRTVVTADSPGLEALPGFSIRVLPSTL